MKILTVGAGGDGFRFIDLIQYRINLPFTDKLIITYRPYIHVIINQQVAYLRMVAYKGHIDFFSFATY